MGFIIGTVIKKSILFLLLLSCHPFISKHHSNQLSATESIKTQLPLPPVQPLLLDTLSPSQRGQYPSVRKGNDQESTWLLHSGQNVPPFVNSLVGDVSSEAALKNERKALNLNLLPLERSPSALTAFGIGATETYRRLAIEYATAGDYRSAYACKHLHFSAFNAALSVQNARLQTKKQPVRAMTQPTPSERTVDPALSSRSRYLIWNGC